MCRSSSRRRSSTLPRCRHSGARRQDAGGAVLSARVHRTIRAPCHGRNGEALRFSSSWKTMARPFPMHIAAPMPSLREWYDKLSEPIHAAKEDEKALRGSERGHLAALRDKEGVQDFGGSCKTGRSTFSKPDNAQINAQTGGIQTAHARGLGEFLAHRAEGDDSDQDHPETRKARPTGGINRAGR